MSSSATMATMQTRVRTFLMDAAKAVWTSDDNIVEALRAAVEDMSRLAVEPASGVGQNVKIATVTPAANAREVSLAALTDLIDVLGVWFPYTAAAPENPPNAVEYLELSDGGARSIFLLGDTIGDGAKAARVFYRALHTLSGLDGATATTFSPTADGLLVIGAAGYLCLSRAIDIVETTTMSASAAPNLAELGVHLLSDFRAGLGVQDFVDDSSFSLELMPDEWQYRRTRPPYNGPRSKPAPGYGGGGRRR